MRSVEIVDLGAWVRMPRALPGTGRDERARHTPLPRAFAAADDPVDPYAFVQSTRERARRWLASHKTWVQVVTEWKDGTIHPTAWGYVKPFLRAVQEAFPVAEAYAASIHYETWFKAAKETWLDFVLPIAQRYADADDTTLLDLGDDAQLWTRSLSFARDLDRLNQFELKRVEPNRAAVAAWSAFSDFLGTVFTGTAQNLVALPGAVAKGAAKAAGEVAAGIPKGIFEGLADALGLPLTVALVGGAGYLTYQVFVNEKTLPEAARGGAKATAEGTTRAAAWAQRKLASRKTQAA